MSNLEAAGSSIFLLLTVVEHIPVEEDFFLVVVVVDVENVHVFLVDLVIKGVTERNDESKTINHNGLGFILEFLK